MTARDVIAQALALSEGATDGPWITYPAYGSLGVGLSETEDMVFIQDGGVTYAAEPEDATFTAAARTLLPALAKALGDVLDLMDDYDHASARWHNTAGDRGVLTVRRALLSAAITDALSEVTP